MCICAEEVRTLSEKQEIKVKALRAIHKLLSLFYRQ